MKKVYYILQLLLFSTFLFAQNDTISVSNNSNISVVAADRMNVVYRGICNPISIAVPNCKSFTASGLGLTKNKNNTYCLTPGIGLESIITIDIVFNDGTKKTEISKFRIKNISHRIAKINDSNCENCIVEMTKEELKDAEISVQINDFLIDFKMQKVMSFYIHFPNKKSYKVIGNTIDNQTYNRIKKLKIGTIFTIDNVEQSHRIEGCFSLTYPIKIMIAPPSIKYYQSRKFIKDSLNNLKRSYYKK